MAENPLVPPEAAPPEGGEIPVADPETPSKVFVDLSTAQTEVVDAAFAEEKMQDVPPVDAEEEGVDLRHRFKRPRETLGSPSTFVLEGLVHADPCSDVPLRRVPAAIRETMARFARPSVLGADPSAHARSIVGLAAARENMLRVIPQFKVPGEKERHPTHMA